MTNAAGFRALRAKYAGRCKDCRDAVAVGDEVLWKAGFGVVHADATLCGRSLRGTDEFGRTVELLGKVAVEDTVAYAAGFRAGVEGDESESFLAWYAADADVRAGWGAATEGLRCPDGCCGPMAPGVVC